jgi:YidC/Oxa1 family membrane protein insertase
MFTYIWHTCFFDPVYNLLVFFLDTIPGGDMGIAIIATVIVIKTLLLPLSIKGVKTQKSMRELDPHIKALKEKHKDDKEGLARAQMELYRTAGVSPFGSLLVLLIQIPVILSLGLVAMRGSHGIKLPHVDPSILYHFVSVPTSVSVHFFGLFDVTAPSILLALCAGVAQYFSTSLAMPKLPPKDTTKDSKIDFKDEFARNMQLQMKYVMPVMTVFMGYISAAIALYLIVSNLMMIVQEVVVRRHR